MFHFTMFGDTQGEMPTAGLTALTLFGGSELVRPTFAQRLMQLRGNPPRRSRWRRLLGLERNLVVTLFGATIVRAPTLTEEFTALRALLDSGSIDAVECRDLLQRLAAKQPLDEVCTSVTLFGATTQRRPTEKQERKALQNARASGTLNADEASQLDRVIASPMPVVCDLLGRMIRPA